jgi:DNA-directed RNA polymerase I, II, and III subunit RPABC2|tara:strand:- start:1223 stop:1573 length:351 start_codon:yes stop_codon:yes gene_type:complete
MDEVGDEEYNGDEYDVTEIVVEDNDDKAMIDILRKYNKHKKTYKTTPALTKYEKCRVLSERANQINCGSQIYISNPGDYSNAYDIAVKEYSEKRIPFIIKRPYGNTFEYWKLKDLY